MKRFLLIPLMIVFVAAFIFGGSIEPVLSAPKEILLGTAAPLTGMGAGFGKGGTFGLRAAVEDINKLGGVYIKEYRRKLPVRIIILDNQSDPMKTRTLAEYLILKEKVNFLISSPQWPPEIAALATAAEKHQTPYVGFGGPFEPNNAMRMAGGGWKHTWLSGFAIAAPPSPGDFRNKPGYTMLDLWMAFLSKYSGRTNRRVGIFASDDPDGRGWYGSFPKALKKAGLNILGVERELGIAPLDTTDFTPIIRKWKDNNCEILLGNAPAPWFGTLWRQSHALGFKLKFPLEIPTKTIYLVEFSKQSVFLNINNVPM